MGQIETRGLTRTFGEVRAVDGVDLVVRPGGLTGFVGGNGAGKTTTMRMVMGVLRPDAGEVLWDDRPMTAADRPALRLHARGARALPQAEGRRPAHLPRPAVRDVGVGCPRRRSPTHLERFGLGDRARERVEALSLGNQQRVQIIAALMHGPTALVLDEPFSRAGPGRRRRDGRRAARARGIRGAGAVQQPPARPRRAALRPPHRARPRPGRRPGDGRRPAGRRARRATGWSPMATPAGCATCAASTCTTSTAAPRCSSS